MRGDGSLTSASNASTDADGEPAAGDIDWHPAVRRHIRCDDTILSVANKVGSDAVTLASGSATLAGSAVGPEAISSVGTLTLGGAAAANYTLAGASGSVTITPATILNHV